MVNRMICIGAAVAVLVPVSVSGQELDAALTELNMLLAEYGFEDHSGGTGQTTVGIADGVLQIEIRKVKTGSDVTTLYRARLPELDLDAITTDIRDGSAAITVPSSGTVEQVLRCITGANANEWVLPAVRAITVELRANPVAVRQARVLLTRAVRLGQHKPATGL